MEQLIDLMINSAYGQYVFAVCLVCRLFVTIAPIKLTSKIPDTVMLVISAFALASNKKADNKGNKL